MSECIQKLKAEGKPYMRSNCAICGQWAPKATECDAKLVESTTPTKPIFDETEELKRFMEWRRKTTRSECHYDPHLERIMSEAWLARAKAGDAI